MAGSSSSSTTKIPPFMFRHLQIVGNEMEFPESQLTLLPEKMVDFESLKENGYDVKPYFSAQGWNKYFDMLNGPIYPDLLKKFWMKARVFTKFEAKQEELAAIERDPSLKGKTRKEMGLLEFTGTQIRSNICGINLTFSPIHFNALLGLDNSGLVLDDFEKDTRFRDELLHRMCIDMKLKGKVKGLTDECRVLFKIILSTISPRVGGTDTISWPHRHLIYFLLTERKVNLGKYFFERICEAIFLSKSQRKTTIVYPRLLSDLLFQGHIVQNLKKFYPELMAQKLSPEVLNASFLTKMHLIDTKLVQPKQEFRVSLEDRLYVDGYPVISEMDAEHIIQDYLKVLKDEGYTVDRSMVPKAPINMYKPKRKPKRKADSQDEQVKPDLLAQKKVKVEQSMAEQRTKKKHEDVANKAAEASSKKPIIIEEDSSSDETNSDDETESDEETLGAKLRKRQVPDPKGKSPKYIFNEAEIGIGFTKPLRTILPKSTNISTSDNPLSELEKHLSPDPLNNQPFTHESNKSSSPSKSKSSDIPSSEPQPDNPTSEQASPTKLPSPEKSPEPTSEQKSPEPTSEHKSSEPSSEHIYPESTSDHTSSESTPEPNPNPSAEHASPARIHTCAPKPSEADVVIIDNPANESPKHSPIPNISPSSSDLFGNLSNQLYDDLLRLSHIKDRFLVCPSDVDMEVSLLKAKICNALDAVGDDIKSVIGKRDMEVVHLMKEGLARASLKRLTMYSHEENERAKLAAISATARRMTAFKECWVDSKLFKNLEDQRIENERLAEAAARLAEEIPELNQEDAPDADILMIDYPEDGEPSSDKGKAPLVEDQLQILQEALREQQEGLERQRTAQLNLESKVDGLVSNVGSLNDKFDQLLAFLKKP
ncbi:unnamed protein product [Trifolium pratense]|uniref:Uncharacterized protein n=1 Tax=Trifolium pratense TaxID=57577 RepID=A0ACB0K1R2_TRIPR|nr:unnamed protein product [Trifolium pratense]